PTDFVDHGTLCVIGRVRPEAMHYQDGVREREATVASGRHLPPAAMLVASVLTHSLMAGS
ncbi:MAG: hypothetical protein ACI8UD_003412, partial [Planctomycetota bacterium]